MIVVLGCVCYYRNSYNIYSLKSIRENPKNLREWWRGGDILFFHELTSHFVIHSNVTYIT